MKLYYYLEESKLCGPVQVKEMTWKGLTKETLVWTEGMDDWKRIGNIPEIAQSLPATEPAEGKPAGLIRHHRIAENFVRIRQMPGRLRNSCFIFWSDLPQMLRHSFARVLLRLAKFINT